MQFVASLIVLLAVLVFVVSRAARSASGKLKTVVFAVWVAFLALLALVVTFAAGSLSCLGEVGLGAAAVVCGTIIAWRHVGGAGRIKLLAAVTASATGLVVYTVWINHPRPIPEDRMAFVGVWRTGSGFTLEIRQDGTATIQQKRVRQPGDPLGIQVAPDLVPTANVEFEGHKMTVIRHAYYARVYTIDKAPFTEGGRRKMVLNGMELVRE